MIHLTRSPKPRTGRAALFAAADAVARGDASLAREILGAPAQGLREMIFRDALRARLGIGDGTQGNLYLQDFEIRQIDLFALMATRMPLVSLASEIANSILAKAMMSEGARRATLVDVGIGSGQQVAKLLCRLPPGFERLHVVGIEPDAASLETARRAIAEAGDRARIDVTFEPLHATIENIGNSDWARIRDRAHGEPLLVNEAFALHHSARKQEAIARIRELAPRLFVLSEPDSDHETADFARRFANCWRHFGLVFDVIDRLELSDLERRAMKGTFFAREIHDIVAGREDQRSERHETREMWTRRLLAAGFNIAPDCRVALVPPEPVKLISGIGSVSLGLTQPGSGDASILAVMAFR